MTTKNEIDLLFKNAKEILYRQKSYLKDADDRIVGVSESSMNKIIEYVAQIEQENQNLKKKLKDYE